MGATKRVDVPFLIVALTSFLYVRSEWGLVCTAHRLAVVGTLSTEFLPMRYPTSAGATLIRRPINVPQFHVPISYRMLSAHPRRGCGRCQERRQSP